MSPDGRPERRGGAFFGRRHGRAMRPGQAAALSNILPSYKLDIARPPPPQLPSLFAATVAEIRLEIGFGGGEHLLHRAATEPGVGFIGVEPFVNGLATAMAVLAQSPLGNLRIHDDDATRLLDWLPPASLAGIDLFYPDPWPKKRHWKRRFVNPANLDRFVRVLRPGGEFRFASDIADYVDWTLLHCRQNGSLSWQASRAEDWRRPFPGWRGTRYEAKALREARAPAYLAFRRDDVSPHD